MTREIALHCMKSYSNLHSDLCELCPIYGETGSDHCFEDALQYVIGMLEQEPTTKNNLGVDCISRKAVLDGIAEWIVNGYADSEADCSHISSLVTHLPSVTLQEPRKGRWIADVDRWGDVVTTVNGYKCDKCNAFNSDKDNYCPNCGADMRGEE